jgi:hypothetical protein
VARKAYRLDDGSDRWRTGCTCTPEQFERSAKRIRPACVTYQPPLRSSRSPNFSESENRDVSSRSCWDKRGVRLPDINRLAKRRFSAARSCFRECFIASSFRMRIENGEQYLPLFNIVNQYHYWVKREKPFTNVSRRSTIRDKSCQRKTSASDSGLAARSKLPCRRSPGKKAEVLPRFASSFSGVVLASTKKTEPHMFIDCWHALRKGVSSSQRRRRRQSHSVPR